MNIDFGKVTRLVGKAGLMLKQASPEIMLAAGVVGIVGAAVLACKATLKAEKTVEETHEMLDEVEDDALERRLPEKFRKKNVFDVYVRQTAKFAKIYAVPVALGAVSLGLIIGSHCVLNRRYLAATALSKSIEEAYKAYRKRVAERYGEETEKDIYYNRTHKNDIPAIEENENGEVIITPTNGVIVNPNYLGSPYARFFDETNPEWKKNAEYNRWFLESQQNYANNILRAKGYLFLNDVYEMLGFERSQAGQIVGWVYNGDGDNYVDFGLYNCFNEKARDFINGYERSILLDFNVDGVIFDKI